MIRVAAIFAIIISVGILMTQPRKSNYELCLIEVSSEHWGYSIIFEEKVIIHQEYIPCIPGNIPFASEKDAKRTGRMVLRKLRKGEKPTLSRKDLERLHII